MTAVEGFSVSKEVAAYLLAEADVLQKQPQDIVSHLVRMFIEVYETGKTLYTMGNGGHGSTASHMVNDMSKHLFVTDDRSAFVVRGGRFRAICLNDSWATMTAWANDMGWEMAFAGSLANLVERGDLVLGISGSGNSPNILKAFDVAKQAGAKTACLAGPTGGKAREVADLCVTVPCDNILQIEDVHMTIAHLCTEVVRKYIQRGR
jgi:D-sedoheptulose 7-phosphate isomerase